jgi:hypothetical protein
MYYTTITRDYIDWHSYGHEWQNEKVVFDEPIITDYTMSIGGKPIVTMSYTVSKNNNNNNKIL